MLQALPVTCKRLSVYKYSTKVQRASPPLTTLLCVFMTINKKCLDGFPLLLHAVICSVHDF